MNGPVNVVGGLFRGTEVRTGKSDEKCTVGPTCTLLLLCWCSNRMTSHGSSASVSTNLKSFGKS